MTEQEDLFGPICTSELAPTPEVKELPPPFELRDYQQSAIDSIKNRYNAGVKSQLVVMATGLGKAVVAANLPKQMGMFPTLITVGRIAIVDQLAQQLQRANPHLQVEVEQGEQQANQNTDIVVASTPTIGGKAQKHRLEKWKEDYFRLVQADEVHHGTSSTNVRIATHFKPDLFVGWTATPWRTDGTPLANLFDEVVADYPIRWGITNNWLCPIVSRRIQTQADLTNLHTRAADFVEGELAAAVNTDWRNSKIISALEDHAEDRTSIVIFCVDCAHAENMTRQLKERGHDAELVLGYTPTYKRNEIYKAFKGRELGVLVGVGVFIEGWDAPVVDCIAMARPTKSPLFWWQAIGRGTRMAEGKKDLLILDCCDIAGRHAVVNTATAFGLRDVDLLGMSPLDVEDFFAKAATHGVNIGEEDTLADVIRKVDSVEKLALGTVHIQTIAEAIDIFQSSTIDLHVAESSIFPWIKLSEQRYVMPVGKGRVLTLWNDPLGVWRLTDGNDVNEIGTTRKVPFTPADKIVKRILGPGEWRMRVMDARWRNQPPSDKQLESLRRHFGFKVLPPNLTRGSASTLITFCSLTRSIGKNGNPTNPKYAK